MTLLQRYLEDPVRFARLKRAFYGLLVVLAAAEIAGPLWLYHDHAHFPFEDWIAFGSLYGFIACVAIIVVSKLLGKLWLMRPENYYDS
jgi:hypothetical protein